MKLVVFRGDAVEAEVKLKGPMLRIGRDGRNDVVLDDPNKGVSRQHCEIRSANGRFQIVDLKSRNGIYIAGRRVKDVADLSLGVPVTVGPFELVLEDDVASGEFDDEVSAASVGARTDSGIQKRTSHSGTMPGTRTPGPGPRSKTSAQTMVWGAIVVAVLAIGGIAWAVIRNIQRPATTQLSEAPAEAPLPAATPPVDGDANAPAIADLLLTIRNALLVPDYDAAQAGLARLRELAPGNPEVPLIQRQIDEGLFEKAKSETRPPEVAEAAKPAPAAPPEPQTPGIPRRNGESYSDYLTRVGRVQLAMQSGRAALGREDYPAALRNFREAEGHQAGYENVQAQIATTLERQSAALDNALSSGRQNEQAGALANARQWYRRALTIDPTSAPAGEREAAVKKTLFAEAQKLFDSASFAAKSQNPNEATKLFRQVIEMLQDGDPLRTQARERLEALTP